MTERLQMNVGQLIDYLSTLDREKPINIRISDPLLKVPANLRYSDYELEIYNKAEEVVFRIKILRPSMERTYQFKDLGKTGKEH